MGTVADLERSRNRHRLADRSGAGALAFSQGRGRRDARSGGGVCVKVLVTGASGQLGRALQARSEEHTSELQSLMRISYAVFCLKKKIKHKSASKTSMSNTMIDAYDNT